MLVKLLIKNLENIMRINRQRKLLKEDRYFESYFNYYCD